MCTCGSNTRLIFDIEIRIVERGSTERKMLFMILNDITRFWYAMVLLYPLMDDELGNATYIYRLLVFSALSLATLLFTLIGNDHMFRGYIGEIESANLFGPA